MDDGLLHGQPLRQRVLARDDHVDVVPAAQAVVEHRQEAVGVRRKINSYDVRLLVDHMIEEAGVLMGEAIMVLLPDMRRQEVVQGRDLAPPRQFERDLQPFRVLAEHRVDDADERLIAVEEAMSARQQIAFEPSLALMLAEHGVQHAALRRAETHHLQLFGRPIDGS